MNCQVGEMSQTSAPAKRLSVLRHAKSSWADTGVPDRERPLAPRGRKAARRIATLLREEGICPDLVLCSPAARTTQTLELVRPGLDEGVEVVVEEALYGAAAGELLDRLRRLPESVGWVMVIGHNPGLQQLVVLLARDGPLRERARAHFPTAALATMALAEGGWPDLAPGGAVLVSHVAPRDLG